MNDAHSPKKQPLEDWHRADIVAALRKAGWTLRRLSKHHGYAQATTLVQALNRSWPKGERLIAEAIGIDPATIWPSRYARRAATDPQSTTRTCARHVKNRRVA